ncbi:MAG: T9SS type A sorting domain-containing protein, partial [Gemmatimonadetes bacterium]|nr:T9SS type A sorting domain-containing protein [Gemmatimonadota bacterium]
TGYNAMNSLPVEFGLGDAAQVDSLVIEWPSGIVERFGAFAINQFMTIVESPPTGVANGAADDTGGAQSVPGTRAAVLHANEPNPFNPATTIRFTMNRAGHATVNVYDAAGRRVARPVDRTLAAGQHAARFDAAADALSGVSLASGIYFYELTVDGVRVSARRMTLIR